MELNKDNFNWYEFDISEICDTIEGDLSYLGTFCVQGQYKPVAVFKNNSPNKDKKHKDFCYLFMRDSSIFIGGLTTKEMEKERYQEGFICNKCKDIVYSVMRHDMRSCNCGVVSIDGGKEYTKIGCTTKEDYTLVRIDFISGKIKKV